MSDAFARCECADGLDSGGLHLLFSSIPKRTVRLPRRVGDGPVDMRYLVKWMKETLVSEREEMFGEGEGV